jgi:IclR family transcriptional regulator, acetate operon repressor
MQPILGRPAERLSVLETCFTIQDMTTALDRGLSVLEHLAHHPEGLPMTLIASELDIPLSACHRVLADLQRRGYVRQARKQGDYVLTTKVVSLGLGFLSSAGIVDIAEPLLERLARTSGELVRLSIVDDDRLTWVAKSQGMRQTGLRYDPDMGMDARLSCTASGHAWLMTLSDERALELVSRQGFGKPADYGPKAPTTIKALMGFLHAARLRGYAVIDEVFAPGMAAMAAPVFRRKEAIGVISVAGPRVRLTVARTHELAPALLAVAAELGPISNAASLFGRPPLGKG